MSVLAWLARRYGARRWFGVLGRSYLPVDRWLGRLTKGRVMALGLPALLLTTTGRRSGQPRTNPLLYVPDGEDFIVIGSNWGGSRHPAWSANLIAHPVAQVTVRGRQVTVRAVIAEGEERARLRAKLLSVWPGYVAYEQWAAHRRLRIFRLTPVASAGQ